MTAQPAQGDTHTRDEGAHPRANTVPATGTDQALRLLIRILDRQRHVQREIKNLYKDIDEAAELLWGVTFGAATLSAATRAPDRSRRSRPTRRGRSPADL